MADIFLHSSYAVPTTGTTSTQDVQTEAPGITIPLVYYRQLVEVTQKHTPVDLPAKWMPHVLTYWEQLKNYMPHPDYVTAGTVVPLKTDSTLGDVLGQGAVLLQWLIVAGIIGTGIYFLIRLTR